MAEPVTKTSKSSSLDKLANIAIIVVCAIAAVVLIRQHFFPPQPPGAPPQAEKGETFAQIKSVLPAGTQKAMVVAVQPGCHFCNDSMPFYKRLIDERNAKSSPVKFIAAVPSDEAKAEEGQKFAAVGTQPDHMVTLDFASVKVPGTPTILLVDNQGKVLDVWVGKLDAGKEKDVLAEL